MRCSRQKIVKIAMTGLQDSNLISMSSNIPDPDKMNQGLLNNLSFIRVFFFIMQRNNLYLTARKSDKNWGFDRKQLTSAKFRNWDTTKIYVYKNALDLRKVVTEALLTYSHTMWHRYEMATNTAFPNITVNAEKWKHKQSTGCEIHCSGCLKKSFTVLE